MTQTLLDVRGVTRRFGGLTAVNGVDLSIAKGELVSVIGPNGAGKSTLFNLITGLDTPDAGSVQFDGRDITGVRPEKLAALGLARTFQHGRVFGNLSVLDNVLDRRACTFARYPHGLADCRRHRRSRARTDQTRVDPA